MPMTIINSSAAIHDYRGKITNAITQLKDQIKKTDIAIETVSENWKDGIFKQFQGNFYDDKEKIIPLCDSLTNYTDNLLYALEMKLKDYEGTDASLN